MVALEQSGVRALGDRRATGSRRGSSSTSSGPMFRTDELPVDDRHRRAVRVVEEEVVEPEVGVGDGESDGSRSIQSNDVGDAGLVGLGDGERPRGRHPRAEALDEPRPHRGVLLLRGLVRVVVHRTKPGQVVELRAVPPERVEGGGGVDDVRGIRGRATGDLVGASGTTRGPRAAGRTCSPVLVDVAVVHGRRAQARRRTSTPGRTTPRSGRSRSAPRLPTVSGFDDAILAIIVEGTCAARRPRRSGASEQAARGCRPPDRPVRSRRR